MKSYDLNQFPAWIEQGTLSIKDAVNEICGFIIKNYKVFNLQKYDEDFRSELVIAILENGEKIIKNYKPEIGDFFTFLYCYINSMVTTRLRSLLQKSIKEKVTLSEGINSLEEKEYKYQKITYKDSEIPKAPYAYKPANIEELKKVFSNIKYNNDKKILVLAMKSSFYLSDEQINRISSMYKIPVDNFYKAIQYFKESMIDKIDKRSKAEERRNFAYYHHKKYKIQLEKLNETEKPSYYNSTTSNMITKKSKHDKNWIKMNEKLEQGYLYLRPTTKSVADVLGICERQVTYYINCAKKEMEKDPSNITEK